MTLSVPFLTQLPPSLPPSLLPSVCIMVPFIQWIKSVTRFCFMLRLSSLGRGEGLPLGFVSVGYAPAVL